MANDGQLGIIRGTVYVRMCMYVYKVIVYCKIHAIWD